MTFSKPADASASPRLPRPRASHPGSVRLPSKGVIVGYLVVLLVALGPVVFWFGFRIEVRAGEISVLTRKVGENLPSGHIIAESRPARYT